MIEDVIGETRTRLERLAPRSADDVRHAAAPVGAFSAAMAEADRAIKGFLYPRMYRHHRVMRIMGEAETVLSRSVLALCRASGRPAGGLVARHRAQRRQRPPAPDRRFHRRHDRPLRAGRARAAVPEHAGTAITVLPPMNLVLLPAV